MEETNEQTDPHRLVGTVLGSRFQITACNANDEAGARYEAMDTELETPATVRVLLHIRPDDASLRRLLELLTEVSNLSLPGVKMLRAVGRTRAHDVYYATDRIVGVSIAQRLERGPMRPAEAVSSLANAGETLARAHLHGVVHGALHPGALILPKGRSGEKVQLLDFGLGPLVMSATTTPIGNRSAATPYQAPEQSKGDPFDQRADVYALGALFFESLTGRQPFAGRSALEVLAHQLRGEAPSLSEVNSAFEGSPLQDVLDQSMQINPDDRFSSVHEMVLALQTAGRAEASRKKSPIKRKKSAPRAVEEAKGAKKKASSPSKKAGSPPLGGSVSENRSTTLFYILGAALVLAAVMMVIYFGALEGSSTSEQPQQGYVWSEQTPSQAQPQKKQATKQTQVNTKRRRPRADETDPSKTKNKALEKAIEEQMTQLSERAQKLINEGNEALKSRRYGHAAARFRAAKRHAPEYPDIARGLGLALMYTGKTNEATRELERYLKLAPNAPDAQRIRATIRYLNE